VRPHRSESALHAHTRLDFQLWSSSRLGQGQIDSNARLHFLSLVHVPSIPLYLAAGPSWDVFTDDESTAIWLSQSLLGYSGQEVQGDATLEPRWASLGKQSSQGILLKIENECADGDVWKGITELLLYAAINTNDWAVPTPPASSSPAPAQDNIPDDCDRKPKEVKVYALPLSSKIISQASNMMLAIPHFPEEMAGPTPACFLPICPEQSQGAQKTHEKRQSLSSLFDDATQKRRKLKGRGGERVAQAMANLDRPASQQGLVAEMRDDSRGQSPMPAKGTTVRQGLARASTMSSITGPEHARPASRSGALVNGKSSSLYRVESAISPRDSPTFSDTDDRFGNQNQAALTKVVMAGMRLYGLQQKKKTGKGDASQGPSTVVASEAVFQSEKERDDDYKLVYHQTFKTAKFAFRKQFHTQVIPQETMRDIVDRSLNLFCTNPIASTGFSGDGDLPGFGTLGSEGSGAFDLPSGKALSLLAPTA